MKVLFIQATDLTKQRRHSHRMNQLALVNHNGNMDNDMSPPASGGYDPKATPMSIATISSGFEKGDFLVREEKGQRVVSWPYSYRVYDILSVYTIYSYLSLVFTVL